VWNWPRRCSCSRERLARFVDRVTLIEGKFLSCPLEGRFEVLVAVGLFDHIADPMQFLTRMRSLCAPHASLVASFSAWTPPKGPLRRLRYAYVNRCPIYDYTAGGLDQLFAQAGFERLELRPGRAGLLAWARA